MKGRVLSYGCARLCSGEGIPALSLPRDMPYSKDTSSCSVNHLLKHFAGSRLYGLSIPSWCSRCLQQLLSRYFLHKSEEYNGLGDFSRVLPGWAWKPDQVGAALSSLCSPWHGAALPIVIFELWPSKSLCRGHRCHIGVLYTELPLRTLLQLLSKTGSQNSQILYWEGTIWWTFLTALQMTAMSAISGRFCLSGCLLVSVRDGSTLTAVPELLTYF